MIPLPPARGSLSPVMDGNDSVWAWATGAFVVMIFVACTMGGRFQKRSDAPPIPGLPTHQDPVAGRPHGLGASCATPSHHPHAEPPGNHVVGGYTYPMPCTDAPRRAMNARAGEKPAVHR